MSIVDDINDISDKVLALEQENEELRQQNEELRQQNGALADQGFGDLIKLTEMKEAYDKLIDLLAEDIEWQEKHLTERTSQKMKDIVTAYRAVVS